MNLSLLIIGGSVVLGLIVLLVGFLWGRRQSGDSFNRSEMSRSRVYDLQIRDHRNSLIIATVLTFIFVGMGLLEWSTFQFRNEWPSIIAATTTIQRGEAIGRRGGDAYYVDAWYRFTINGTRYNGSGRLGYEEQSRRDQAYNNLNAGSGLRVWYHPLIPAINLPSKIGPVFAIVVLSIGALTALGMISSGVALINTKIKGGPKQKPVLPEIRRNQ
jgi:hypothetical protein